MPMQEPLTGDSPQEQSLRLLDMAIPIVENARLLLLGPLLAGLAALAVTFAVKPTFTARTSLLPPQQQQQNAASLALASLGALSNVAGAASNLRTPADQYVALLQSEAISDKLIDEFKLIQVYDEDYRVEARKELAKRTQMSVGKKDGLISIEVEDKSPERAAALANRYVDELRKLTSRLALTEAQQRRAFFASQIDETRDKLTQAQLALQASGFSAGALRAEPRAAADAYARAKAEATAAEVRLQVLRRNLADNTPEVQQQLSTLSALKAQISRLEGSSDVSQGPDYVAKYREFKYQESLFEMLARQFELARLDEAREGALIQVVDAAAVPEKKSWPKRGLITVATALVAALLLTLFVIRRHRWRESVDDPAVASQLIRLRAALRRD
jgi:uncharacterized protein involved in exopolysaccharide biosynthesis